MVIEALITEIRGAMAVVTQRTQALAQTGGMITKLLLKHGVLEKMHEFLNKTLNSRKIIIIN